MRLGGIGGWGIDPANPNEPFYVEVAETYTEILHLDSPAGKLPTVRFRNGRISLSHSPFGVRFKDGTESIVRGKEYIYSSGRWFQK